MIEVSSFHQLMLRPWNIVTAEGLSHGQEIYQIFLKPHLINSSYRDFEKVDEI